MLTGSVPISYRFKVGARGIAVAQYVTAHGTLRTAHTSRHDTVHAAKRSNFRHFSTSLASSFSDTRGALNFLSVHSCSQNRPLISCVCVEDSVRTTGVRLNFYLPAFLAKKIQRRPQIFCTVSVEPLVIYSCALYN